MFGQDREQLRRFFKTAWQKHEAGEAMEPLEKIVAQVITQHPEYQQQLSDDGQLLRDFIPELGEANPWLHMGMHISLAEQLGSNRPPGIREHYRTIVERYGDRHRAEHAIMECLGMILWEAQRSGTQPDEQAYLTCLSKLTR